MPLFLRPACWVWLVNLRQLSALGVFGGLFLFNKEGDELVATAVVEERVGASGRSDPAERAQ